jgi:hypothetical protein
LPLPKARSSVRARRRFVVTPANNERPLPMMIG